MGLVIDTDTASDDAVAIVMAVRYPATSVRALTTVAGNVPVEQATRNALVTLETLAAHGNPEAAEIPVFAGADRPLLRTLELATHVHGLDGLGNWPAPEPNLKARTGHAVEALLKISRDEAGEHQLVTIGPLTNIAACLVIDPLFLTRFSSVYLMAGAFDGVGNIHPVGEFNVWVDPEAATMVFNAPGNKTAVGWDVSRRHAMLDGAYRDRLLAAGPLGEFVIGATRAVSDWAMGEYGSPDFDLPDPIAMAAALMPQLITRAEERHVRIGLDEISRGGTLVDYRAESPKPNVKIAWEVSGDGFRELLFEACREPGDNHD
jgi:purine nucleosidase